MGGSDPKSFFQEIYADNPYRVEGKRSIRKDLFKFYKNRFLRAFYEKRFIRNCYDDRYPLFFIVGPPRTGTTFLYQLLVNAFDLSYITNFMAPYWMAPLHAMKLQYEKGANGEKNAWSSTELGNTEGPWAPHEFGYFWQYWMQHQGTDELDEEALQKIPWERIGEELYGLTGFSERPLLIKNLNYIDHKVEAVAERFPTARFIRMDRSPEASLRSILKAREKRYGDRSIWWSIRPANYGSTLDRPPEEQVAYQYFQIQRTLDRSFDRLDPSRWTHLHYEELMQGPKGVLERLLPFLGLELKEGKDFNSAVRQGETGSNPVEEGRALNEAIEKFAPLSKEELERTVRGK